MTTMNKSELITAVATRAHLSKADAQAAIDALVSTIQTETDAGVTVKIVGFGKFEAKDRAARIGRNPRTGEEVQIPASRALTFKAGKPKAA